MTKFKVGDKVRIKDEVLTNYSGKSLLQDWRGKERVVEEIDDTKDYWLAEEGASSIAWRALLDGKHLELVETFEMGDWVYVKDEELTTATEYQGGGLPDRATWYMVNGVYDDGDLHLIARDNQFDQTLVHRKHVTHNPFKVGDRVEIEDGAVFCGTEAYLVGDRLTEMARGNPVITALEDVEGDIRVDGIYIHKRFVKPVLALKYSWTGVPNYDSSEGIDPDPVNSPAHYTTGLYETIDVIEDWELNMNAGNAVKYISRYKHKGKPVEDLRKAIWYLNRELSTLEAEDAINS